MTVIITCCLKAFTGGASNELYGYYEDGKFPEDVIIFRIGGEGTDLLVDRKQEKAHLKALHAEGLCAPLYAEFNNGIAYGYIDGETVDVDTVRNETVRKYTEIVRSKQFLQKELEELWDHLEALNSPIVFCHNDLLPYNIIYNRKKDSVHFIDFEYSMYNCEHFEIGNHFCCYMLIDQDEIDFNRYPDKTYQLDWIKFYLECKAEQNDCSAADVTDRDIEDCYVKTNKFTLLALFFWVVWCLIQTKFSKLDFDFLKVAGIVFGAYFDRKEEFFALQLPA